MPEKITVEVPPPPPGFIAVSGTTSEWVRVDDGLVKLTLYAQRALDPKPVARVGDLEDPIWRSLYGVDDPTR
jgi:hypothetical protein